MKKNELLLLFLKIVCFFFSIACSTFIHLLFLFLSLLLSVCLSAYKSYLFPCWSPQVLRLGNSADALESAKRAVHLSDVVLRFCITVSHINRALYFACDNVLWAGKSGLAPGVDQEKWAQRSFRFDILLFYRTFCIFHTAYLHFIRERFLRVFPECRCLNQSLGFQSSFRS